MKQNEYRSQRKDGRFSIYSGYISWAAKIKFFGLFAEQSDTLTNER